LLRVDGATKLINEGVGDVKGAVGNVQKAVDTVAGVIDDIKDALPISGDCKFFCK
jgi:hypothetical protein